MANPKGDVPVFVDAVAAGVAAPLVRCNYLVIETDTPLPGWSIKGTSGGSLPLLLLGLEGVIVSRLGGGKFASAQDVEALFSVVEVAGFNLEVSDLWLPDFLFKEKDVMPTLRRPLAESSFKTAGAVLRVTTKLFTLAFQAREGNLAWEDFARRCTEEQRPSYSEEETRAFADWHDGIQEAAFDQSPKDAELELPRRNDTRYL